MSPNGRIFDYGPWVIEAGNGNAMGTADYETAISTTGYGIFHILLLLATVPVGWTCVLDSMTAATILPAVECIFELTFFRKGILVTMVYMGMVVAGPLWDFIFRDYVISYLGHRTILLISLLINTICNVLWTHTSSFYIFLLLRFISGLMIGGPLTSLMPYLSEFHSSRYKQTFERWAGFLFSTGNVVPAALAYNFLPHSSRYTFTLFNRFYEPWRVFLAICGLSPIVGFFALFLLPESPKALLERQENKKALRIIKYMYRVNSGKSSNSLKIRALLPQLKTQSQDFCKKTREAFNEIKALFSAPCLAPFSIIVFLQFGAMIGFNIIRLWMPQLFVVLNNFNSFIRWASYPSNTTYTMCEMLNPVVSIEYAKMSDANCIPSYIEPMVYYKSAIIVSSTLIIAFISDIAAVTRIRKKIIIVIAFLISVVSCVGTNWAKAVLYMLILCSTVSVTTKTACNIVISTNAQVIPPSLRPTATSLINIFGNVAVVIGNLIFSAILATECLVAFMALGCLLLFCGMISFFLPCKPVSVVDQSSNDMYRRRSFDKF